MTPALTAAICTRNRAADLARALASLADEAQTAPLAIMVIDNGSTDDTAALLASAKASIPHLVTQNEPAPGLSAARNLALAACTTPLLAYIDDDAVAQPGWAAAFVAAFTTQGPGVAAIGGRILPDWEVPPPPWMTPDLATYYSALDLGPGTHRLSAPRIFGANMAFRTDALRAAGGFSPRLGRTGANLAGNEEIAALLSLDRRGFGLAYCGSAVVHHKVEKARLEMGWLEARIAGQGASDAILFTRVIPAPRAAARAALRAISDAVEKRGFEKRLAAAYLRGFISGLVRGPKSK